MLNKTNVPDKQIRKAQTRLNHTGPSTFPHIAEPALQRGGEKSHGSTSVQLRCSLILHFSSTFAAQNEALQMGSEPAFLQEEGGRNLSASSPEATFRKDEREAGSITACILKNPPVERVT